MTIFPMRLRDNAPLRIEQERDRYKKALERIKNLSTDTWVEHASAIAQRALDGEDE